MGLTILVPLVAMFELLLRRSAGLRPYRVQLRVLLGFFFLITIAVHAGSRFEWLPADMRLGSAGVLRFAADSLEYQAEAAAVATAVRKDGISQLLEGDVFAYSRLLAGLYTFYGLRPITGMLFNAVFYMTSVICVLVITRKLFDDRTAVLTAWIVGLWPSFLLHETQTLRWVATTAGIHMSLASVVLFFDRSNLRVGIGLAAAGYLLILYDLPYITQLLCLSLVALGGGLVILSLREKRYLVPALVVVVLAASFVTVYRSTWPPTPGSQIYTWAHPPKLPSFVPASTPAPLAGVAERLRVVLEGPVNRILDIRERSIADALQTSRATGGRVRAGTAITDARPLHDVTDLVRNLPTAYAVALLAPSPRQLLGPPQGMMGARRYVLAEMLLYYALLPLTAIGIAVSVARPPRGSRVPALFVLGFTVAVYGLLGTVVMNGGTLHRLRLPYVLVQFGFAVAGARALRAWWVRRSRHAEESSRPPVVLLSIPNTLSTRNLLRTEVLPELAQQAERVIIVAPFADEREFRDEFVHGNLVTYRMVPYRPTRAEALLTRLLYNLYLGHCPPASLQLFLARWGENHPRLSAARRFITSRVFSRLRFLTPALERTFVRIGDAGRYSQLIAREQPDLAVFSRLFFCDEIPLMRAVARAGIPTVGIVASWDNLTTKGPLLPRLDRLVVWNEHMRSEACTYHRYTREEVAVVGAPHHDPLFAGRERFATRADFFARIGFDPIRPLIVYAGEDPIIAPDAPQFVELMHGMIEAGRLPAGCQLLVRPHPQDDPRRYDALRSLPDVRVDLPGRVSDKYWMDMSRQDLWHLYETLRHADVVINVASTIVVDAALVDTPSICIGFSYSIPPTYQHSPMRFFEMDHFRYVVDAGATTVVASEGELGAAIVRYLNDPGLHREGRRRLVAEIAQFQDGQAARRTSAAIMWSLGRRPQTPLDFATSSTVETGVRERATSASGA